MAEKVDVVRLVHQAMDAEAMGRSSQCLPVRSLASFQCDHDGASMLSELLDDDFVPVLTEALGEHQRNFIEYTQGWAESSEPDGSARREVALQECLARDSGHRLLSNTIDTNNGFPEVFRAE